MKTLDVEQLSCIAGAEPRGTSPTGRQNDGYDIVRSKYMEGETIKGYERWVHVRYNDGSSDEYDLDGTLTRSPR
jgi:hypothetical protein